MSCGGPQADRAPQRVEVGDETLIESVELVTFLFGEMGISGDRPEQAGGEWGVDALEEFEKEDADAVAVRQ